MVKERFKVGDYVIIKKSTTNWTSDMNQYVGKRAQLTKLSSANSSFRIDLDNGYWNWNFKQGHFIEDTDKDVDVSEEWIPKIGDVLTLTNFKDDPIVTITNIVEDIMDGCKWVNFEPKHHYGGGFRVNLKNLPNTNGYYLGKDFKVNYYNKSNSVWEPQVGDYAIMERAGGWGYNPDNNGCLAIIDAVGERKIGADLVGNCISGRVLNPKYNIGKWSYVTFVDVPVIGRDDEIICRKALPHEINIPFTLDCRSELTVFPQEGCVYESPENMKDFVNYLLNRPGNRADGKIDKSDAIGIAWNQNSCWWLKTKASAKTVYSLSDLNNFLSIPNSTPIHKSPEKWYVKATKENEKILKKWRNGVHTGWSDDLVMTSGKYWDNETDAIKQGFLEISYDDFLKYVYHPEQNTGYIEFSYKKETEKYPQQDNKIVIPSISPVKINIDYSIKTISKISLPDFTVEPIKVESIIVKPFKLNY